MDCGTPTAILLTINLLLKSIILTLGASFLGLELKDFYLNTPTDRPEFFRINVRNFPEDVIEHYKLREKVDDKGFLYIKCVCGMYGLPHAGTISHKLLRKRLRKHSYRLIDKTPGF